MIAVATPAMLPVPIDAASAVMNAWNGVSAPVPRPTAARTRAPGLAQAPDLHDPRRSVRNSPAPSRTPTTHGMNSQSAADWIDVARRSSTGVYIMRM